jgi:ferrous-iron efflux pump FieF
MTPIPSDSAPPPAIPAITPERTARLLRQATYASVGTATLLILAKFAAWLATGSVSVLASLVDSTMDAGASLVNLFAVRWSLMPPDREHRFGHGKAQALAALGQATFIVGSAGFLVLEAADRLLRPRPLEDLGVGLVVIAVAIVATLILLAFQRHVIRLTNSPAIRADSLHYATDLATNLATLCALILAWAGWPGVDPLFGLGIGAYVFYSAVQIGREAVDLLMDRELPDEQRQSIAALAAGVPGVLGVHGLRTRQSGQSAIVQLHLELPGDLSLTKTTNIAGTVETTIREFLPGVDLTIHQEPARPLA